jgi:hypothetical protein
MFKPRFTHVTCTQYISVCLNGITQRVSERGIGDVIFLLSILGGCKIEIETFLVLDVLRRKKHVVWHPLPELTHLMSTPKSTPTQVRWGTC